MNVVYTFDDGYTDITLVSITSFFESNKEVKEIVLYIVDCGITEWNIQRIKKLALDYGRSVIFVEALDVERKIPIKLEKGYWSLVCYVRLFFAEMMPEVKRIMHIDCDTIVRGNLEKVYNVDLEELACAMCYDCLPSAKYAAGFEKNERYFSNGFMIFNLEYIRKNKIENDFINYIVEKEGVLPHLDQDAVSAVLKDSVYLLPAEYNVMSVSFALSSECTAVFCNGEPYYSKKEMKKALDNPLIVHFVGYRYFNRPWNQPCYHPYNQEWINYYNRLSGCEGSLLKKRCSLKKRIVLFIWNTAGRIGFVSHLEKKIEVNRFKKKSLMYMKKTGIYKE